MDSWQRAIARLGVLCCALFGGLVGSSTAATITVHFDQDVYLVNGPGDVVPARVLIDADANRPGETPVPGGLFSFGVLMSYPTAKAELTSTVQILAPTELEHFSFDAAAFRRAAPAGEAGIKGNVDATFSPIVPYADPWLATFQLTNLATGPDSYPLGLDFFRTVGINEQIFLDGNGGSLDASIVFRPARVVVVPEPRAVGVWPLVGICVAAVRRRRAISKSIRAAGRLRPFFIGRE